MTALGIDSGNSKSEVSRICAGLDETVAAFRSRPRHHTAFPCLFLDATYLHVRRAVAGGQVTSMAVVIATGVTATRRAADRAPGAGAGQAVGHYLGAPADGAVGPCGEHPSQCLRSATLSLRRRGDRTAFCLHHCAGRTFGSIVGELSIKGSLTRRGSDLLVSDAKTQRSRRVVSLSPAMVRLIIEHRPSRRRSGCAGNLWEDSGFVFTTEFGGPVDPRNLLRTTTIAAKRASLPQIGVHTLRHTYATTALLNNVPMQVVSRNLGHSPITADIYGHLTDDVPGQLR